MANSKGRVVIIIGKIAIVILTIAIMDVSLSVWSKPYTSACGTISTIISAATDTKKTLVVTNSAKEVFADSMQVDTLAINTAFLKAMRERGELLSSDEFASRITDYYNTLVAVLTALFILFTLVTYLTIRSKFEGKFEDKAKELENKQRELEDKQRQKIIDELRSMLSDSKKIDEVIQTAIGGRIDDNIASKEDVDDLADNVDIIANNISTLTTGLEDVRTKQRELYKVVTDLQDQVANGATIVWRKVATEDKQDKETPEAPIRKTELDKDIATDETALE